MMLEDKSRFGHEGKLRAGGLKLGFPDSPDIDERYRGMTCLVFYRLSQRKVHIYIDGIESGGSIKKWVLSELHL